MDKRKAKIKALEIASALCAETDIGMWDSDDPRPFKDMLKIVRALHEIGFQLGKRAEHLQNIGRKCLK